MPSERTTVTELGTGLGMLGLAGVDEAVRSRSTVMRSVSPEMWEHLVELRAGGAYDAEFHAAWANGQAFLSADDGLRGRLPQLVEWKGTGRAPGDEVAPIDLRVDHVYLVSCKYLSKILFNVSPGHVFDALLASGAGRGRRPGRDEQPGGGDWYAQVAPSEYQALYAAVRRSALEHPSAADGPCGEPGPARPVAVVREPVGAAPSLPGLDLAGAETGTAAAAGSRPTAGRARGLSPPPATLGSLPGRAVDLTTTQREALAQWLRPGWPPEAKEAYGDLSVAVARASARRWEAAVAAGGGTGETLVWRLLRIGSAPYFVLGSSESRSLRLRIGTSWDWRQQYRLMALDVEAQRGGQPRVGWTATVRDRASHAESTVAGHIEVRWSHGRFGGPPEAKGYLDTPHHLVPGYFALR